MKTCILIPSRLDSTRFPRKPLALLDGVPMIKRIYDRCASSGLDTYVVTPDEEIAYTVDRALVVGDAENGTARCALALEHLEEYTQFVNVQGDMPDVTVDMIEKTVWHLQHYPITTLWTDMPEEQQHDPNTVKMITAGDRALWFGRGITGYGKWHLGIYGYKRNPLEFYPTYEIEQEERVEGLEQLRWLKAGWDIGCLHSDFSGVEINEPGDIDKWHKLHQEQNS